MDAIFHTQTSFDWESEYKSASGDFEVYPIDNDVPKNVQNVIHLLMRNAETGRSALSLKIQVSDLTNSEVTLDRGQTAFYMPGFIYAPSVHTDTRVKQSSDNPCARNLIEVRLVTNVPIFRCVCLFARSACSVPACRTGTLLILLGQH